LNTTENDKQLSRYRESLDNLILTDYLDFRFFKDGEKVAEVTICRIKNGKIVPLPANIASLETLLRDFAAYEGETITSAKTLAVMMARKAKLMREVFCKALMQEDEHTALKEQLEAFRRILLHDIQAAEFADVYAQTITCGLFTARLHELSARKFSRMERPGDQSICCEQPQAARPPSHTGVNFRRSTLCRFHHRLKRAARIGSRRCAGVIAIQAQYRNAVD
jgi:hypothetical protein